MMCSASDRRQDSLVEDESVHLVLNYHFHVTSLDLEFDVEKRCGRFLFFVENTEKSKFMIDKKNFFTSENSLKCLFNIGRI